MKAAIPLRDCSDWIWLWVPDFDESVVAFCIIAFGCAVKVIKNPDRFLLHENRQGDMDSHPYPPASCSSVSGRLGEQTHAIDMGRCVGLEGIGPRCLAATCEGGGGLK